MNDMPISPWNRAKDGGLNEQALHQKPEGQGYRVTHYVYPPGRHFPEHTHAVEKIGAVRD